MGRSSREAGSRVNYCLEPEAVEDINRGHVVAHGEPFGVRDHHGLLSALARPNAGFGGWEPFPTPVAKAGALIHGLASAHPFVQGNKRTAWSCATTYLGLHGFGIEASVLEATQFVLAVVAGSFDANASGKWIAARLTLAA